MRLLSLRGITRVFHGQTALNNISYDFEEGRIYALIGPNGAGKTTLINIVNNVLDASSGEVLVDGAAHSRANAAKSGLYTVLAGDRGLYWRLTGRQNIFYFLSLKGIRQGAIDQRISNNIGVMGRKFPALLDKRVEEMSFGQKKQLALFIGIISDASCLIIDEITEGLDVDTREELVHILRSVSQKGKTIIFAAHDLPFAAEACDIAVFLHNGEIKRDVVMSEDVNLFDLYRSINREV